MMQPAVLDRYADVLLWGLETARTHPFAPGDLVLLRYHHAALPLADVLFQKLIKRKLQPIPRAVLSPAMETAFYGEGSDDQIGFHLPGEKDLFSRLHGSIYLHAPDSMTHLADVDPSRMAFFTKSRKPFKEILDSRDAKGDFGWTLCLYPTAALAAQAGMGLDEYIGQIEKACYLNMEDPVANWQKVLCSAQKVKAWLDQMDVVTFHIQSEHTDLTITPGSQRKWLGLSGHNIPSFELFISPDWRGTTGVFHADQASFRNGRVIRGITLRFEKGEVVAATATEGEDFLKSQLAMDDGARRVGEFSLTDRRFSRIDRFMANTLFDENFGGPFGNSHIAIGSAYADSFSGDVSTLNPETKKALGFNDSALHWDVVNTEPKTVTATCKNGDSILIYENGEFTLNLS